MTTNKLLSKKPAKTRHFQACCEALWGPQYRSEAARQLGVGLRSMMRYDAGERDIPDVLGERVQKLLVQRSQEIAQLLAKGERA